MTNPIADVQDGLTTCEAAKILRHHPNSLARWRMWGVGPEFFRVGRAVYYTRRALAEWLCRQRPGRGA